MSYKIYNIIYSGVFEFIVLSPFGFKKALSNYLKQQKLHHDEEFIDLAVSEALYLYYPMQKDKKEVDDITKFLYTYLYS